MRAPCCIASVRAAGTGYASSSHSCKPKPGQPQVHDSSAATGACCFLKDAFAQLCRQLRQLCSAVLGLLWPSHHAWRNCHAPVTESCFLFRSHATDVQVKLCRPLSRRDVLRTKDGPFAWHCVGPSNCAWISNRAGLLMLALSRGKAGSVTS